MTFQNPILPPPSADPWIVSRDGWYYFSCSEAGGITIIKSRTITGLASGERRAVWKAPAGAQYSHNVWAPEIHFLQGRWYIYFAADDGDNRNHRMYVLESKSDDALGEYVFKGSLGTEDDHWAIDGTVLETDEGELVFIWSGWPGDEDVTQELYMAPMSNPWTVTGERIQLSKPEHDWECHTFPGGPTVNEGPQVLKRNGRIHVIYSASHSSIEEYCLGLVTHRGGSVLDPANWEKAAEPVFVKNPSEGVYAVGHCSFTLSPDGTEDWILYHAMSDPLGGWENRSTRAQRFTWSADGLPVFGAALGTDHMLKRPSGE